MPSHRAVWSDYARTVQKIVDELLDAAQDQCEMRSDS